MPTTTKRRSAIKPAGPAELARYFKAKLSAELGPHNVRRLLESGEPNLILLDVRSAEGYREGHLPGARHIPFEDLPRRITELPKSSSIVSYCWDVTCFLSAKAAYVLAAKGYRVREMVGGIAAWEAAGFPIEK